MIPLQLVTGIINVTRNSSNGKSGSITGIQNLVRIQNGNANNTGELVGFRNSITRSGATAGRVTGNVYGWFGSVSGPNGFVDGNIYGVFLSNVAGASAGKNAFYSGKGLNRLGDSVLITDGGTTTPRAVLMYRPPAPWSYLPVHQHNVPLLLLQEWCAIIQRMAEDWKATMVLHGPVSSAVVSVLIRRIFRPVPVLR